LCPTCYELEREDKDDEAKEEIKTINQSQEQIHTGTVSADKPTTRTCAEIQSDSMGEAVVLQGQDR
jgi:hypothetical protein